MEWKRCDDAAFKARYGTREYDNAARDAYKAEEALRDAADAVVAEREARRG